jgi:hypothetical protein
MRARGFSAGDLAEIEQVVLVHREDQVEQLEILGAILRARIPLKS